jgi:hypothetical protein
MGNEQPTPGAIMQLSRAYAGSKALLSAVQLALFTTLADRPLTDEALRAKLGLQPRGTADWLDALVSLGTLDRDGDPYANTATTDLYLDGLLRWLGRPEVRRLIGCSIRGLARLLRSATASRER